MRTLKLGVLQKESVLRQIRKTAEKPLFRCSKKCVETYSSSNAAAQNPEERKKLTWLHC